MATKYLTLTAGGLAYAFSYDEPAGGDLPEGAEMIDAAWLAARTPPYALSDVDKYYALDTNVSVNDGAFNITANGVTLDLNGHTITYDNSGVAGCANSGFETAAGADPAVPANWTITSAPGGARVGWGSGPPCSGDWQFQFTEGEEPATQTITSEWFNLPASRQCVLHVHRPLSTTYYFYPLRVTLEHSTAGIVAGWYNWVDNRLYLTTPATAGQYRVNMSWMQPADPAQWANGTTYYVGDFVLTSAGRTSYKMPRCTAAGGVSTATTGSSEPTWPTTLGETVVDGNVTWQCESLGSIVSTTAWAGSTALGLDAIRRPTVANGYTYRIVRLNVSGTSGGTEPTWYNSLGLTQTDNGVTWTGYGLSATLVIDECNAIPSSRQWTLTTPNWGIYVTGDDVTIKDGVGTGAINQGSAAGYHSHAIRVYADRTEINGVTITTNGFEAAAINVYSSTYPTITQCDITCTGRFKFVRTDETGAVMIQNSDNATVSYNTIRAGRVGPAILLGSNNGVATYNTLTTNCSLVNNHAIFTYGKTGIEISHNDITADPGQGILLETTDVVCEYNTIDIMSRRTCYNTGAFSIDGIRANDYYGGLTLNNVLVRNNTISVYGETEDSYDVSNQLMVGICVLLVGTGNVISDNTITTHQVDADVTLIGMQPGGRAGYSGTPSYIDNVITSDQYCIAFGHYPTYNQGITFSGNEFAKGDNPKAGWASIWANSPGSDKYTNITFISTTLTNGASLRDPSIPSWVVYDYDVKYVLTVHAQDGSSQPISGADVVVKKTGGTQVSIGTTDANGDAEFELFEFELHRTAAADSSADFTEYNDYTVEVTVESVMQDDTIALTQDDSMIFTFT